MDRFEPVGGALALDFVNTVGWRTSDAPEERLTSWSDFREWAETAGLELGRREREPGAEKLQALCALRESLYRLFLAFASERRPAPRDLAALNRALRAAPERRRLTASGSRIVWEERGGGSEADQVLWAVTRSAAKVLTEESPERIKRCEGEGCGWLFLDTSRARARRWCSMSDCGNRAKAKRHYARRRKTRRRKAPSSALAVS